MDLDRRAVEDNMLRQCLIAWADYSPDEQIQKAADFARNAARFAMSCDKNEVTIRDNRLQAVEAFTRLMQALVVHHWGMKHGQK